MAKYVKMKNFNEKALIVEETTIEELDKKVSSLSTQVKCGWGILAFLFSVLLGGGWFLGDYVASLSNNISDIKEKHKTAQEESKNLSQEIVKYKNEIEASKNDMEKSKNEFAKFLIKIEHDVGKAKLDAEAALKKAGLLVDAVNSAQSSATRAEEANLTTQKTVFELQKVSDNIKLLYKDITSAQKSFESFVAKNTTLKQPKQFTVKVSGSFGKYTIYSGNGIAYDREISGSSSVGFIVVPKESFLIIEDSGSSNRFDMTQEVQPRVIIKGKGTFRIMNTLK